MIRIKRIYITIVLLFLIIPVACFSQNNLDSAKALFTKLSNIYANTAYLSFNIEYTYADVANPSIHIDSLKGKVTIGKGCSHVLIANTETICDSNYSVMLFKDEMIMYLSKPVIKRFTYNPAGMLDSFLEKLSSVDVSLTNKNNMQVITIFYPPGNDYKSAEFFIDPLSGFLVKTRYVLKDALFTRAINTQTNNVSKNEWGVMESNFSDYRVGSFASNEFNTDKYFTKSGTDYKPTDAFNQYKIFIGSPDL